MKVGLIARSDATGLGNQTRNLAHIMNPDKILLIDFTAYNNNSQRPEFYKGYNVQRAQGFPSREDVETFCEGLDAVFTCETFYGPYFYAYAEKKGIKLFLQYNYEFLDILKSERQPWPDVLIAPSLWNFEKVQSLVEEHNKTSKKKTELIYLPPPTDDRMFEANREVNFKDNGKHFLHVVGRQADKDRNGTESLLEAMKFVDSDCKVTIKSRFPLPYPLNDNRIIFDYSSPYSEEDLYKGYDAMILPRRYAGLCLPMNEALMSGLPVIMTDIEPNNKILPKRWLVESSVTDTLMTRTLLNVYSADVQKLADKIEWLCNNDLTNEKKKAWELGCNKFSYLALSERYDRLFNETN